MDKPIVPQRSKSKTSISKIAAEASISFWNIPFSPGRDNRHRWSRAHHHYYKGFSGPLIPSETHGRSNDTEADQEPTSPRVSCMGQIKKKNKLSKKPKHSSSTKCQFGPSPFSRPERDGPIAELKKIFGVGRKTYAASDRRVKNDDDREAPSLGQMRKFASSRDALAGFDWTRAREEKDKNHYDDGNGDGHVIIPFSGPIFSDRPRDNNVDNMSRTRLETKKENSLWKRRAMARP